MDYKYIKEFQSYMMLDKCSIKTIDNYLSDVSKFIEFCGNKPPIEISKFDIVNYSNHLEVQKLDAKTINRKLYAVYKFVNYLNDTYNCNINIDIRKIKMKITNQEYGRNVLSKTDFKRILNAAIKDENILFVTLLYTLYFTGMRISEALDIKVKDTKYKEIQAVGKGRKQRYVPVPDELKKHFRQYLAVRESSSEYLFINKKNGRRLSAWMSDHWIKKYARHSKVDLKKAHCHNIRHLYCYIMINEKGMDIAEVAQLVGHSDINITRIYNNRTRKQLFEDIRELTLD